ncbi:hypothetical protein FY528_00215 [Hymenobacter lutimineralis]|uniref:Uncharacterized protein n=1 Tax=Hymenobacter lutimineralis TaxID=2606448 RepID=A0A5D6VE18_9BACT|nr:MULTISPECIES: hypothetical protein [Hymenobacter]QIX60387.1 hypothetical protein HER32_03960 [Hymenobacter sp. BT18]TYZ14193.1 hypothetical protein FY528_00215 [Hymenobacter lutimineralis]
MKHLLSARVAANGILVILTLMVVFHLLVLTGVVPYGIVWGGRLKSPSQMLLFETLSISLNLLMLAVVSVASGRVRLRVPRLLLKGALWLMTGLFLLNTLGNLVATTTLEKLLFTPVTLLPVFCLRLAVAGADVATPRVRP